MRSRRRNHAAPLIHVLVLAVLVCLGAATASAAPVSASVSASTTPRAAAYLCADLRASAGVNSRETILQDRFAWGSYPARRVGNGRGDIDWRQDPHHRVSWRMWLNALRWLGPAVEAARGGDTAARDHALAIARDWGRDHPGTWQVYASEGTMHRTNMMLCLREAVADPRTGRLPAAHRWLDALIARHGEYLAARYSGVGNHGTNESIALFGVGVTLARPALRDTALARMRRDLPATIDRQGATNEQSIGYVRLNHELWSRARATLAHAGVAADLQRDIGAALVRLATFFAHATNSLQRPHQIGDTEQRTWPPYRGTPHEWIATGGASGRPPRARVATYAAGYVFGRSGWGAGPRPLRDELSYSLRYGPRRALHGHHDKTSITMTAHGRDILVDPGLGETTRDAWDAFFTGFEAHNALVAPGMSRAPTVLDRSRTAPGADVFRVRDRPGAGFSRTRDALFLSDPDLLIVIDRATAPTTTTFRQYWHLASGQRARVTAAGAHVTPTGAGAEATSIVPLRVGAARAPGTWQTLSGSTRPVQGWHWLSIFTRVPAPTVWREARARSILAATAVVPTRGAQPVRVRTTVSKAGTTTWTITVGSRAAVVGHRANGDVFRVR